MPEETTQVVSPENLDVPNEFDMMSNGIVTVRRGSRLFPPGVPSLAVNIRDPHIIIRLAPEFARKAGLAKGHKGQLVCDFGRKVAGILLDPHTSYCPQFQFQAAGVRFTKTLSDKLIHLWTAWDGRKPHYYEPSIEEHNGKRYILFSYADIVPKPSAAEGLAQVTPKPAEEQPVLHPDQDVETPPAMAAE